MSKEAKYVLQVCAFLAYQGFFVIHLIYLAVFGIFIFVAKGKNAHVSHSFFKLYKLRDHKWQLLVLLYYGVDFLQLLLEFFDV